MIFLKILTIYIIFAVIFANVFDVFKDSRSKYEIMGGLHYCLFWPYYSWIAITTMRNKK